MRRWPEAIAIPAAILRVPMSPLALRLWALLAKWNDAFPSNKHLLEWLPSKTDERSLQRAKVELVEKNLLKIEPRTDPETGRQTSSKYELMFPGEGDEIVGGEGDQNAGVPPDQNAGGEGDGHAAPLITKKVRKEPPTPAKRGPGINPRAKGTSLRDLGRSPRQLARAGARHDSRIRMARTIGHSFADVVETEKEILDELAKQLGIDPVTRSAADVELLEFGFDAWRARRAEASA